MPGSTSPVTDVPTRNASTPGQAQRPSGSSAWSYRNRATIRGGAALAPAWEEPDGVLVGQREMVHRFYVVTILAFLPGFALRAGPAPLTGAQIEQRFDTQVKPFLTQHCFTCHGDGKNKGDLTLDRFKTLASIQDEEEVWRHVSDNLRQNVMPPDNKPRPPQAEIDAVVAWIGDALAWCDCTGERDPGRVAIRR